MNIFVIFVPSMEVEIVIIIHYFMQSSKESPIICGSRSTVKFSAMVAPMTAKVSCSSNCLVCFIEVL